MEESIYFDPLLSTTNNSKSNSVFSSKFPTRTLEFETKSEMEMPIKVKDRPFILAYMTCLIIFLITGIGNLEWTVPSKIYNTFVNTLMPELKAIMIVSGLTGLIWTLLLSYFTKVIVYGMLLVVPLLLSVLSLFVLFNSGAWLVSLGLFGIAGIFFALIKLNKDGIESTISIVKSAAVVLRENGSIYVYSFSSTLVYIILVLGWMVLFAGLYNSDKSWLKLNAVLVLIWTGSIIGNFQKGMIANCVHNWYEKKERPFQPIRLLGQYCFGGVILTFIDGVRFINWGAKKSLEQVREGGMKMITNTAWRISSMLESLLSHYTQYSILQVAISQGELGFLEAGQKVYGVFRRNILISAINDMTSSLIFAASGACIGLGSGLLWHVINREEDQSTLIPITVSIVTFMVLRFFSSIYTCAIDSAFLCYSLELDSGSQERPEKNTDQFALQQAFSVKLSQLPK